MSTRTKVLLGAVGYLAIAILLGVLFGNQGKNEEFKPQNEFKLDPWISLKIGSVELSAHKAVFSPFLGSGLAIASPGSVSRRPQSEPNPVRTAIGGACGPTP